MTLLAEPPVESQNQTVLHDMNITPRQYIIPEGFSFADAQTLEEIEQIIEAPDSRHVNLLDGKEDFSGLIEIDDQVAPDLSPIELPVAEEEAKQGRFQRMNSWLMRKYVQNDVSLMYAKERAKDTLPDAVFDAMEAIETAPDRLKARLEEAKLNYMAADDGLDRLRGARHLVAEAVLAPTRFVGEKYLQPAGIGADVFSAFALQNKTGDVLREAKEDFLENPHKVQALGSMALVVTTEALDRSRLMVVAVPKVVMDVFENTHSPTKAGLAGAALFTAWNLVTSEILAKGLHIYPRAKEMFKEKFPAAVQAFRDALPGANKEILHQERQEAKDKGSHAVAGNFIKRHTMRSLTALGIGTTAFVATSSANGDTLNETRKEYLAVSADAAVGTWTVAAGVTWLLSEMPKWSILDYSLADVSQWLYNRAIDTKTWMVFAGLSIGAQWVDTWNRNRQVEAEYQEFLQEEIILDEPEINGILTVS